ncbi:MAG TPA: sigma-54 dependent transcriptional regulator [Kofleriaceae bacterium]
MPRVLIADADVATRTQLGSYLNDRGFVVNTASSLSATETELRQRPPDVAIIDCELASTVEDVMSTLKRIDERVPIILLTAHASLERAVLAVKQGAEHFLAKPVELPALHVIVQRILEAQRTRRRTMAINVIEHRRGVDPFIGKSAAMEMLAEQAHRVLDSHTPILIQGETGTGKGVLASWLHHHGPRAEEAFVDINCAGLSREFVESELFGHERGAFTGAASAKLGLLDVAHRGTAFLDEIGEIDLQLQPRLLKVLEEKRFRRLGDVRDHVVDIRLIAATNRDLARRSREGTFRADLYYRINTISLVVPSLRRRREDIPLLARQIAIGLGHDIDFTADAIRALEAYDWPGNVRELKNVIERAVLLSNRSPKITTNDLRFEAPRTEPSSEMMAVDPDEPLTLEQAERRHIEKVLKFESGSVERAAVRLGVSRSTLYQKLRRYKQSDGAE